jgi:hypothetical protein
MKTVSGIVMFVLLGGAAFAQQAPPTPRAPKAVTEIAVSSEKMVRNAPFSAEAVSESVQTLSDGNRIVRSSTTKLYRNSEGRFRREFVGGAGGGFNSLYTVGPDISILDPIGGFRYMIDPELRTTRQIMITPPKSELKVITGVDQKVEVELKAAAAAQEASTLAQASVNQALASTAQARASVDQAKLAAEKIKSEVRAVVAAVPALAATAVHGQMMAETLNGLSMFHAIGSKSKWETRTEELGTQNIEGVDAEGTRTITTIPAGAIGNERPIEITYEKWYSKELQMVVMSKHSDPRYGEQTYRLTNINRSEPDPSLFTPPHGYKLVTDPSNSYTYTTAAKAYAADKAAAAKAAQVSAAKAAKP